MTTISRYILSQYSKLLGLCFSSFITIYLVIDFLEKLDRFSKGNAPAATFLFFLYKVPEIIGQVAPMATLMATILTLGVMSRNSEVVAMKGCGIGLGRIAAPIMGAALFLSGMMLVNNEVVIPRSYQEMRRVERLLTGKGANATVFRQYNIWHRHDNLILQARLFNSSSGTLTGVTVWQDGSSGEPTIRINADSARLATDGLILMNATVIRFPAGGPPVIEGKRPQLPVPLLLGTDDLKVVDKHADNMGFVKLREYADKLRRSGYDPSRFLAQMHAKLALPFAPLIMAFLGIPFSLRGGRSSGIAMGVGISLIIGLVYFLTNAILLSFGQTGVLPPMVSAWAANLLFAAIGLWFIMTVDT